MLTAYNIQITYNYSALKVLKYPESSGTVKVLLVCVSAVRAGVEGAGH